MHVAVKTTEALSRNLDRSPRRFEFRYVALHADSALANLACNSCGSVTIKISA